MRKIFIIITIICFFPLTLTAMESASEAGPAEIHPAACADCHALVILNDTTEKPWNDSRGRRALTCDLLTALHSADNPILTTESLWHTMLARQKEENYQKPLFKYDPENWLLYTIGQTSFFLALPKRYHDSFIARSLSAQTASQQQDLACGLKLSTFMPIEDPFNPKKLPKKKKHTPLSPEILQQVFVPKTDYPPEDPAPSWNIYLGAHGCYQTIAECPHHTFREILHFLNNVIKTNIFIYRSCHSGCQENRTIPFTTEGGQPAPFNYTIISPATNASMTGEPHKYVAELLQQLSSPDVYNFAPIFHPHIEEYDFDNIPWVRWPGAPVFEPLITPDCTTQIIDTNSPETIHVPNDKRALLFLDDCRNRHIILSSSSCPVFLLPANAPKITRIKKLSTLPTGFIPWHIHPPEKANLQPHMFLINQVEVIPLTRSPQPVIDIPVIDIEDMGTFIPTPPCRKASKPEPLTVRDCIEIERRKIRKFSTRCLQESITDTDKFGGNHNVIKRNTLGSGFRVTEQPKISYNKGRIGKIACWLIRLPVIGLTMKTFLSTLMLEMRALRNDSDITLKHLIIMVSKCLILYLTLELISRFHKRCGNWSKQAESKPPQWNTKFDELSDAAAQEYRDWFDRTFEGHGDEVLPSIPSATETTRLLSPL